MGIDIVKPLSTIPEGHYYIVVATSYLTKLPKTYVLKKADASFLFDNIICHYGSPYELLSDQETHFCNVLTVITTYLVEPTTERELQEYLSQRIEAILANVSNSELATNNCKRLLTIESKCA
ncbi:14474_t:CDS:2, partial [Dentiscutata erythropus]